MKSFAKAEFVHVHLFSYKVNYALGGHCLDCGPSTAMSGHRSESIYYDTQGKLLSQEGHPDIPCSCSAARPSGGEIKGLG